ncbi:MAG: isopentenyl-diphosphate delta-isomerase [Flavobacteriales bacterium]|nr:MAG: isopentenyl-diphosphate delta-isomerase [Flavobacteriales bacterium]PIE49742.1 MAG: isopentenyl-diphosphate delta-isomerase [Flavobacteriales bacterium]
MQEEQVILVDKNDNPLGTMPKMEAHQKGKLHRAFSVFIYNNNNELLLQQRAAEKYHSPLLWTNSCCSHQRMGETNVEAGKRRLQEEMGFTTDLKEITSFIYKAEFDNDLTEHEYDHILEGYYNENPEINPAEVADFKWMPIEEVKDNIAREPDKYTAWFKIIFDKYYHHIQKK